MTPFEQLKALLTAIGAPHTTIDGVEKKDTGIVLRSVDMNCSGICYIFFRKDGTFREIDVRSPKEAREAEEEAT